MRHLLRLGPLAGVACLSFSGLAHADDRASAQELFDAGQKLMTAHDYAHACPKFEESQRLDPAIGTLLNLGNCYEHEGRLATAWAVFLEAGARAKAAGQTQRVQVAHDHAESLSARAPRLLLLVPSAANMPALVVKRDGEIVGRAQWGEAIPVDPGSHTIVASAPGLKSWSQTVTLAERDKISVTVPELVLDPAAPENAPHEPSPTAQPSAEPQPNEPTPPPPARSGLKTGQVLAIASGVVGVAGIGVGTYFGVQAISKHNRASEACPSLCDTAEGQTLWNDAVHAGNVSTVAFIVGGVGPAGAAVLWFTTKGEPGAGVALGIGPGSVRVRTVW
jgi:hypothetical protein